MDAVGIVCELDPLHRGHEKLLRQAKADTSLPVVCAMSGNFTQRGGIACVDKFARAKMAVGCGADLVVELPTPWAMATAEVFAAGGVSLLAQCGVSRLYFGSECGDVQALDSAASALLRPDVHESIRRELTKGIPYAAARQRVLEKHIGSSADLLSQPNNTLAAEYLKAIHRQGFPMTAATVRRTDGGHHGAASASSIRAHLRRGEYEAAFALMPPSAAEILRQEVQKSSAPTEPERLETAMLCHLRLLSEEAFLPYDGGGEGLYHRVYQAVQRSATVEEILTRATTKRYPAARVRRMLWSVFLALEKPLAAPPYVRVLAATADGRKLLRQMQNAGVPVLTKPADVGLLGLDAQTLFIREARRTDVFALACPGSPLPCGSDWRHTPTMI